MQPVPILLYHSVADSASDAYRPWTVAPSQLAEHLAVVAELGYTTLTVSDFLDRRGTQSLPAKPCLVTFDDGRADFLSGAVPVLVDRGATATVYVVSGHIGGTSAWLPMEEERGQPMMSWSAVRDVDGVGIEVGAHSESHRELDVLSAAHLEREVVDCRRRLSEGLGHGVRSFAYPHGYHSKRVIEVVRAAGFDSAAAVYDRWSHVDDFRFGLSRMFVWDTTEAEDLRATLNAERPRTTDRRRDAMLRGGWRAARWVRHRSFARAV